MITAEEFERIVGRPPEDDDLDRVNCGLSGLPGHWQCGWCLVHNKPRFVCLCDAERRSVTTPDEENKS